MMEEEKSRRNVANNKEGDERSEINEGPNDDNSSSEDEVEDQEDAKQTHKYQETRDDLEPEDDEKQVSDDGNFFIGSSC